jgi:uncharacterized protein (DUF885 family)
MDRRTMMLSTAAATLLATAPRRLPAQDTRGAAALDKLFDQFMRERLDMSPLFVTELGMDSGARARQKSEVDDGSEAGLERYKALNARQLKQLQGFDRSSLDPGDALSYDVVMYRLQTEAAANQAFAYGSPGAGQPYVISQLDGAYQEFPSFLDNQHTINTKADADAYIQRLHGFATLLGQEIEVGQHDSQLGVVPPDFALAKTLTQLQDLRKPAPEESSLTQSVARRAHEKGISGDYAQQASRIVREQVYPALERQIAYVRGLQPHSTHDAGVWRLPHGEEYYAASLQKWATTRRPPAEIHQLGLDLVRETTAQIDTLMRTQGMTSGSVGQRLRAMYTDPKFQYANTDEAKEQLLADLNKRVQSVRAKLPQYFGVLPKANVEIKRVPKEIQAGAPGGYYNDPSLDGKRPGIYWINLRDTAEVPKWTLPTLTYHESIPGHHLQLSIQREAKMPLIRRVSFYSAYIEGWALYAEQLAVEMGEYQNDVLGHIGQLHDAMLRAVRLVVDTGMHSKRWSREQAVQYFTSTLGDLDASAVTEIERYCVWPGQACSYMLGKMQFLSERQQARQRLGSSFDIRKFHDAMLTPGAVPLDLMSKLNV